MSHQIQDRTPDGTGLAKESTPFDGSCEPKFVAIGARVGRSGQVFETNGHADRVVKLFTWAAGLPVRAVRDFTRDVIRVADLHHPNVAQVFDAGMLADGTPFVVMERLGGATLDEAARDKVFSAAEVLPILVGIGSALSAAHATGIAHGQLRADNVFADLATRGPWCAKVLDFGVARLAAEARRIGRGSDAFGHRAAERVDQLDLATLARRLLRPTSPAAFERVLQRALSPDPRQRFGSVAELVEALEEAAAAAKPVSAGPARTLAFAPRPVLRRSPAAAVIAPIAVTTGERLPMAGPPLQVAAAPSSLTQQFFAAGERLDQEYAVRDASAAAAIADEDEGELETVTAARVPRSRAQMTAVAFVAMGSVALIVWTVVSLATKPDGAPRAPNTSAASVVVRPIAVSPAKQARPARTTDRVPPGKPIEIRRAASVKPPPFASGTRPSATASEAPAAMPVEAPGIPAPRPWVEPSSATTGATSPSATAAPGEPAPSAAPKRNAQEAQAEEHAGDEPGGAAPAASTRAPTEVADPESDEGTPAPPAREPAAPTSPAAP